VSGTGLGATAPIKSMQDTAIRSVATTFLVMVVHAQIVKSVLIMLRKTSMGHVCVMSRGLEIHVISIALQTAIRIVKLVMATKPVIVMNA
jgi:hypothetical protein